MRHTNGTLRNANQLSYWGLGLSKMRTDRGSASGRILARRAQAMCVAKEASAVSIAAIILDESRISGERVHHPHSSVLLPVTEIFGVNGLRADSLGGGENGSVPI